MDKSRYALKYGNWLDARRALWMPEERVLAVADPHLGYAWVHRARGQLMPLTPDNTVERLLRLSAEYQPAHFVLVGDIVHAAARIPGVVNELSELIRGIAEDGGSLVLAAGNHDRGLNSLLAEHSLNAVLVSQFQIGEYTFVHGDQDVRDTDHCIVIGHEHPAIRLGDGVATSVKYPCFLLGDGVVVLPAFSEWAAGTPVGSYEFLSPISRRTQFKRAIAITGGKLLPVDLK